MQRVRLDAAWVLHKRDFRDSSQIVELLTHGHGRVSVVARGIKRPKHRHRGLLQAFSPLRVSWTARGELGTLTDVEASGQPAIALVGDALLAGFYVSELCMKLTHRHDPQPEVFALYGQVLGELAEDQNVSMVLRRFEDRFLNELGFGLNWAIDVDTGQSVDADGRYEVLPDTGPRRVTDSATGQYIASGQALLDMAVGNWQNSETLRTGRLILTRALDAQLDGKPLQTRRVLREIRHHARSIQQFESNDDEHSD